MTPGLAAVVSLLLGADASFSDYLALYPQVSRDGGIFTVNPDCRALPSGDSRDVETKTKGQRLTQTFLLDQAVKAKAASAGLKSLAEYAQMNLFRADGRYALRYFGRARLAEGSMVLLAINQWSDVGPSCAAFALSYSAAGELVDAVRLAELDAADHPRRSARLQVGADGSLTAEVHDAQASGGEVLIERSAWLPSKTLRLQRQTR